MWQEWAVAFELVCLQAAESCIQLQQTEHAQGRVKEEEGEGGEEG